MWLKVMHPQFRHRQKYLRLFHTEARSAARLHHTNIVSVFDYGVQEGMCYYAMQYIAGHSLDKILEDVRRLRKRMSKLRPGRRPPWSGDPETYPRSPATFVATPAPRTTRSSRPSQSGSSLEPMSPRSTLREPGLARTRRLHLRDRSPGMKRTMPPLHCRSSPIFRWDGLVLAIACHGDEAANAASPLSQLAEFPVGRIGNPSYGGRENHHAEARRLRRAKRLREHAGGQDPIPGPPRRSPGWPLGHRRPGLRRQARRLSPRHRAIEPDSRSHGQYLDDRLLAWPRSRMGKTSRSSVMRLARCRYVAERPAGSSDGRCDVYAWGRRFTRC